MNISIESEQVEIVRTQPYGLCVHLYLDYEAEEAVLGKRPPTAECFICKKRFVFDFTSKKFVEIDTARFNQLKNEN